ncbi:TIGR03915 family putative DNA repair protein [Acinetobacter tianfuensis]|uniref:DNA metabolism protein n=1 Tax=Acinetobacter tianfuensis TaxID=2419603 RepID=A0A3A8ELK0_9GAMM|nr:TIGR03915 family putative DNA repair protein [Acinetobacter tianfuensis]RKG29741.1 DNA metabolism protein [Acinetobacter tianfuensis]
MPAAQIQYVFDGSKVGLLSCIFRAFQFKEFDVSLSLPNHCQHLLLADDSIDVANNPAHAERVWAGLQQRLSRTALRQFYLAYLSESLDAFQHLFDYAVHVFLNSYAVEKNYMQTSVLAVAQWAKKVGREKHRMEAFVRFKKTADDVYLSLIAPDFNVLPVIAPHFKTRYQDQKWLIYDETRQYGLYYDLSQIHEVSLNAHHIDAQIAAGHSQHFIIALNDAEELCDRLWKTYFQSVNIQERQNLKLHVQYVPQRYWRYLNEKQL